ncbi:MAG: alpha/beta hydrolase [Desulfobacteraceae bacterium]|nr:MAG: alpha/beta hydrolase [Desulfobacteraceae bacterium]
MGSRAGEQHIKDVSMLQYQVVRHETSKEWVMLLHGLGGSSSIWYRQVPELSKHYNLILPDFFGHGISRQTLPVYTFERLADEMALVLDDLNLDRVHLLGVSMGSGLGSFMGVYHPSRIKSMVLGGATLGMDFRTTTMLHAADILRHVMPYMWLYRFFAWIMMPRFNHSRSRHIFIREAHKLGRKEFMKWYRLLKQFPLCQLELQRPVLFEIPKLFISGSQDHLFLRQVVGWTKLDHNATLHIIKDHGHLCNIESPEEFNRVCLDYLRKHEG